MAENLFNSWEQPESPDRLDMVFSDRFKGYGAYLVRLKYRKSKALATAIAASFALMAASAPIIADKFFGEKKGGKKLKIAVTTLDDVKPPDEEEEEKPKEPPKAQEPEPVATQAHTSIKINEETQDDFNPEPNTDVRNAGKTTKTGSDDPFEGGSSTGGGDGPVLNNNDPAPKVQIEAKFPGGDDAFRQFIVEKFAYPERCKEEQIEGYVKLKFVVDVNGRISRITVLEETKLCPEFAKEAIRVLQISPRWIPAQNNGKFTTAWRELPIRIGLE